MHFQAMGIVDTVAGSLAVPSQVEEALKAGTTGLFQLQVLSTCNWKSPAAHAIINKQWVGLKLPAAIAGLLLPLRSRPLLHPMFCCFLLWGYKSSLATIKTISIFLSQKVEISITTNHISMDSQSLIKVHVVSLMTQKISQTQKEINV